MAKSKNTGLGRGLDAIFADNSMEDEGKGVSMLRISEIEPNPDQPRKQFDAEALAQLADSIATHGLIQPIVVRGADENGYYRIIAGERRWRASKMAGLTEVPVIVMDVDDKNASELALIENVQRENLNAVEEAGAYAVLLESYGMTQEEVSRRVGKSRSAIANTLRLLELPDEVLVLVKEGDLSAGHARALLALRRKEDIPALARLAADKELSVRALEKAVRLRNEEAKEAEKDAPQKDVPTIDYTAELARRMTTRMGRHVRIAGKGKNRKLEISFETDGDLEELVRTLCGENIFDE